VKLTETDSRQGQCSADECALVKAELNRILLSDGFRQADRLRTFLSFVVNNSLSHPQSVLKGYTIAVEAFGKATNFDPQDPYVRNIAKDVRTSLNVYYGDTANLNNGVRIQIPKGAYTAKFDFQPVEQVTGVLNRRLRHRRLMPPPVISNPLLPSYRCGH